MNQIVSKIPVTSTLPFEWLLRNLSNGLNIARIGFVIVPQEGEDTAGLPSAHTISNVIKENKSIDDSINMYISDMLNKGTKIKGIISVNGINVNIFPIVGNFGTPVGYLWYEMFVNGDCVDESLVSNICNEIAFGMELSKRNFFYQNLSKWLLDEIEDVAEINDLIKTVELGVYCDKVFVWELQGDKLVPKNFTGLELPRHTSSAGIALESGSTETVNNIEESSRFFAKDFFLEKNLRSCFLIPVKFYSKNGHSGILGAFYKRNFGTTNVDKELCEYAVRYHELIWKQKLKNSSNGQVISSVSSDQFYKQAVNCLFDFHDLPSIIFGLDGAVEQLELLNNSGSSVHVNICRSFVEKMKEITLEHDTTISLAKDHKAIATVLEEYFPKKENLTDLIANEVDFLRAKASSEKISIEIRNYVPDKLVRIQAKDVKSLINNTVSNSLRSFIGKTHVSKKIKLEISRFRDTLIISTWDNGSGIKKDDIDKIFEPHFTTHKSSGGKGLGLAKVRAIMVGKYAEYPQVKSVWGEWTEVITKARIYP